MSWCLLYNPSDMYCDGCLGGVSIYSYGYTKQTGGIELASSYPYTSYYDDTGVCAQRMSEYQVPICLCLSLSVYAFLSHFLSLFVVVTVGGLDVVLFLTMILSTH